jgi:hypothetical protein
MQARVYAALHGCRHSSGRPFCYQPLSHAGGPTQAHLEALLAAVGRLGQVEAEALGALQLRRSLAPIGGRGAGVQGRG